MLQILYEREKFPVEPGKSEETHASLRNKLSNPNQCRCATVTIRIVWCDYVQRSNLAMKVVKAFKHLLREASDHALLQPPKLPNLHQIPKQRHSAIQEIKKNVMHHQTSYTRIISIFFFKGASATRTERKTTSLSRNLKQIQPLYH